MNVANQSERNLDGMYGDIAKAATAAGVPYDAESARKTLEVFQEYFLGSPVSFRTTTKPAEKRDLAIRYMEFEKPHDPFVMALENGLIVTDGHPMGQVIPQLQANCPVMGYGVDVGMSSGLAKIWVFFSADVPLKDIYALPSMPSYLKDYDAHFDKYGFEAVNLVGVDFLNRTLNLYFALPGKAPTTPEGYAEMLADLGFEASSPEELNLFFQAKAFYYTFSWDSNQVERLCYVTVAPKEYLPAHLNPLVERYVASAPFLSDLELFFMNPTYARKGNYIKIESDYTGTFGSSFVHVTQR